MLLRCGEERGHSSAAWKNATGISQKLRVRVLFWSLQKVAWCKILHFDMPNYVNYFNSM